jgi:5-oxoprolinase (ATP-hydrolysing) subunit A
MADDSKWRALGDSALWAPRPAAADPLALFSALRSCAGVLDAVVTEERVAVYFHPGYLNPGACPSELESALERAAAERASETPRELSIRARYDGPDLDEVAELVGRSREEVVDLHTSGVYFVGMLGFLPGFAYLGGLDPRLIAPRRRAPRPRVEAGSVAIAARYTAVYPFASPGGWNVIGHAEGCELFRSDAGATLRLGDRVRFERVG